MKSYERWCTNHVGWALPTCGLLGGNPPARNIVALLLLSIAGWIPLAPAAETTPPSAAGAEKKVRLPTNWNAWPGFFPILPWDWTQSLEGNADRQSGMESLVDCGFTVAGFVRAQDLDACQRLGLKAIVQPDKALRLNDPRQRMADEDLELNVKKLAEATRNHPALLGYYIVDEPGANSFAYLGKIVAAIKKYAPGKLAYINLLPGYATLGAKDSSQLQTETFTEYLERYVNEVHPQFLSYDDYMVEFSNDFKDAAKRERYFADLIEVRRVAMEHQLPFWNIVSSNQIRPFTTPPSPANLLVQAWTTLAAGGRGVSWFKYGQAGYHYAPLDKEGRRTITWSYLQMVNRQLRIIGPVFNRLKSTGVFVTEKSAKVSQMPGRLVEDATADSPLMIGEFESDAGLDHIAVVNLSLERSAKVTLQVKGKPRLEIYSPADGSHAPSGDEIWLTAGQGALLRVGK